MDIDTSSWAPFDPNSIVDAMCERERHAFTGYVLKRIRKQPKTGSDDAAIWTGGVMALVQICYATHDNNPPDSAREALHKVIDFSWLQCAAMVAERGRLS